MPALAFISDSMSDTTMDAHHHATATAAAIPNKDTMVTGVKEFNQPIDHIKSALHAPFWGVSTFMLAIYVSLLVLHCWRYHQTRTRQHIVTGLALFIACIGLSFPVATDELHIIALSFPLMSFANLLAYALPAYLLARWGRSMTTFASTLNRFAFYTGLTWSALFSIAVIIVITAWSIIIGVLSIDSNPLDIVDKMYLFFILYYTGNGMMIGGTIILTIYALCLLFKFPRHTTPGMLIKRKQVILLVVLFNILLVSSASMLLLMPYISYCVMAIYYTATLFPQTALTGFETEPCLIVIQLDTSHLDGPPIVQVSPEPMGQHQKRVSHRHF